MPLTNVWCKDKNGEWIRTTAKKTEANSRYTISAQSRMFRCYYCYHYVTFVKETKRASYFRHSPDRNNKCIEKSSTDRAVLPSAYETIQMPMRITVIGNNVSLEIGLLPVRRDALNKAVSNKVKIEIHGSTGIPEIYRVDYSRFSHNTTSWLPLPLTWASSFSLTASPNESVPKSWKTLARPIPYEGALFDVQTGRRVAEKGDVMAGRTYYWLKNNYNVISYHQTSVSIEKVISNISGWTLYKVEAQQYSEQASDFFFDHLHLRLTNQPAEISVLWPPMIENDDMFDTNHNTISFYIRGEAEFEAFPRFSCTSSVYTIRDNLRVIELKCRSNLQIVCAERYCQTLECKYIRPFEFPCETILPLVEISDEKGKKIEEDSLSWTPSHRILYIQTDTDGVVDVLDNDGFIYRKKLVPGEATRLTDLTRNHCLVIRVGLDIVREVRFSSPAKEISSKDLSLELWNRRMIPFDKRYANILNSFLDDSEFSKLVVCALKKGRITKGGWNIIRQMMEKY